MTLSEALLLADETLKGIPKVLLDRTFSFFASSLSAVRLAIVQSFPRLTVRLRHGRY